MCVLFLNIVTAVVAGCCRFSDLLLFVFRQICGISHGDSAKHDVGGAVVCGMSV